MLTINALIESYSFETSLIRIPCEFRMTDGVIRISYEDEEGNLYAYSGGLKDKYWSLTAVSRGTLSAFASREMRSLVGGQGTLHYELDQDGRVAYVGSWWEDWKVQEGVRRISGLWIIRLGAR